jgi:hypothetical protein
MSIIPAQPGTRGLLLDNDSVVYHAGPFIHAWCVTVDYDFIEKWPESSFLTAITYTGETDFDAVLNPDGSCDFHSGGHFASIDQLNDASRKGKL